MKKIQLDFKKGNGLIPVIIQNFDSGEVFMLGYANSEALKNTLKEGLVFFWSRSRKKLWMKGEESGNKFKVKEILVDCDQDSILIKVELIGTNGCHTGARTCFFTKF